MLWLRPIARLRIERNHFAVGRFVVGAKPEHVLGRALENEEALTVVLEEDRHPPSFKIERHLVDLTPAVRYCARRMLEDRLVKWALQSSFEATVERCKEIGALAFSPRQVDVTDQ